MTTTAVKEKLAYEKPTLEKDDKMNFPTVILEKHIGLFMKDPTGQRTICKQCSSCHSCR